MEASQPPFHLKIEVFVTPRGKMTTGHHDLSESESSPINLQSESESSPIKPNQVESSPIKVYGNMLIRHHDLQSESNQANMS